ncbi:MAG: DUF6364 family protein [Ferruginibacter sp.]
MNYEKRLNLTVDDALVEQARRFASKHQTSLSRLVEQYFKSLTFSVPGKSIIKLVEGLPTPAIDVNASLKDGYYEDQKKKNGF